MAFTPEQEAKMKALWDQGVRDDATLLAAAGVGTTQTQTAPTTPQGVVPAPMPEDRWRYPDVPREPGDVGFIEGGGVLGAAARAPLIGQALGALGWVGENIYDPFATSTLYGILLSIAQRTLTRTGLQGHGQGLKQVLKLKVVLFGITLI